MDLIKCQVKDGYPRYTLHRVDVAGLLAGVVDPGSVEAEDQVGHHVHHQVRNHAAQVA